MFVQMSTMPMESEEGTKLPKIGNMSFGRSMRCS